MYQKSIKELFRKIKQHQDKVAVEEFINGENVKHSYKELYNDVLNLATLIKNKNFTNYNIAVVSDNSYRWIVTFFAIVLSNNVVVPVDKDISDSDYQKLVNRIGIKLSFVSSNNIERLSEIKETMLVDIEQDFELQPNINEEELVNTDNVDEDEIACIILTSGSSGFNKAVMLTNKNILSNTNSIDKLGIITKDEGYFVSILPMFHSFELFCEVVPCLTHGLTLFIESNIRSYISDLLKYKPEIHVAVPSIMNFLCKKIDKIKDLKFKLVVGGAAVDKNSYRIMLENGFEVYAGYGMSEASPLISIHTNSEDDVMTSDTFFTNIKIGELINDREGEILIKGDNVTPGYYQDEEATRKSYTEDGWFKTGDIGYIEDNKLHFTGRLKNTIILENGKNVQPEQIEEIIYSKLDYIDDVVVTQMNMNNKECIGAVFYSSKINLLENTERIINDIKEINKELEEHQRITNISISNIVLPKNKVLKILRKQVKESLSKFKAYTIQ